MYRSGWLLLALVAVLGMPGHALAGMPSVLSEDFSTYLRLNAEPHQRLQTISFFLVGLLAATWFVRVFWNLLARDFPRLPRLTYFKASVLVMLWGVTFIVVLTMIAGAGADDTWSVEEGRRHVLGAGKCDHRERRGAGLEAQTV